MITLPRFSCTSLISIYCIPFHFGKGVIIEPIGSSKYSHALHSSGCLKGNARPLSIAAILISDSLLSIHFVS